jgi:hypothetical protein
LTADSASEDNCLAQSIALPGFKPACSCLAAGRSPVSQPLPHRDAQEITERELGKIGQGTASANWYDPDVLEIDQGISVLMAENPRSGLVWNTFMRNRESVEAMQRAGFHGMGLDR